MISAIFIMQLVLIATKYCSSLTSTSFETVMCSLKKLITFNSKFLKRKSATTILRGVSSGGILRDDCRVTFRSVAIQYKQSDAGINR